MRRGKGKKPDDGMLNATWVLTHRAKWSLHKRKYNDDTRPIEKGRGIVDTEVQFLLRMRTAIVNLCAAAVELRLLEIYS